MTGNARVRTRQDGTHVLRVTDDRDNTVAQTLLTDDQAADLGRILLARGGEHP